MTKKKVWTDESLVLANRIKTIDRNLDRLEEERAASISRGMRMPGIVTGVTQMGQNANDEARRKLHTERAGLVKDLKRLMEDDL